MAAKKKKKKAKSSIACEPEEKPFRFFDLPRELRDAIYDLLPVRARVIQKSMKGCPYRLWRRDVPKTYLLQVSRQFKEEYSDRMSKQNTIRIEDRQSRYPGKFQLPSTALSPTKLTCDLVCVTRRHKEDLNGHAEMIEDIMRQVTTSPVVQLTIFFNFGADEPIRRQFGLLGKHDVALAKLTGVASIDVIALYVRKFHEGEEGKHDCTMVARYTKDDGWKMYLS